MPTTIDNKFLIKKETVFVGILFFGMLIAYYSSLYPWPLWPLKGKVSILAAIILLAAFWIKIVQKMYLLAPILLPQHYYTLRSSYIKGLSATAIS